MFDALIVSRLGEMVERDGQGVAGQVRGEISLGIENLAQQGAGIVRAGDMLAQQRSQAGFGAIGDHLDGIDEMLPLGAQTSKAVFFRQGLHRNVMRGVLAQLFKFLDLQVQVSDLFPQVALALLKSLEFRLRGIRG